MTSKTVWYCDACGLEMPEQFTMIAWDLCPDCINAVRGFLRRRQADLNERLHDLDRTLRANPVVGKVAVPDPDYELPGRDILTDSIIHGVEVHGPVGVDLSVAEILQRQFATNANAVWADSVWGPGNWVEHLGCEGAVGAGQDRAWHHIDYHQPGPHTTRD